MVPLFQIGRLVTFPRFVLSGAWYRNLMAAGSRERDLQSRMKVTSIVVRYSVILPFSTWAFCSMT